MEISSKQRYFGALSRAEGSLEKARRLLENDRLDINQSLYGSNWSSGHAKQKRELRKIETAIRHIDAEIGKGETQVKP